MTTRLNERPHRRGLLRLSLAASGAMLLPACARAEQEPQPLASELANAITDLDALVLLPPTGGEAADVTLYEFFDYNCPYCRRSAADLPALRQAEPGLAYGLVNFAVLGIPSITATRVALAFALGGGRRGDGAAYLALHRRIFELRGPVDGNRVLGVAEGLGADRARLAREADADRVTKAMTAAVRLGDALGFQATPTYVGGTESLSGFVDLTEKRKLVQNLARCERAQC